LFLPTFSPLTVTIQRNLSTFCYIVETLGIAGLRASFPLPAEVPFIFTLCSFWRTAPLGCAPAHPYAMATAAAFAHRGGCFLVPRTYTRVSPLPHAATTRDALYRTSLFFAAYSSSPALFVMPFRVSPHSLPAPSQPSYLPTRTATIPPSTTTHAGLCRLLPHRALGLRGTCRTTAVLDACRIPHNPIHHSFLPPTRFAFLGRAAAVPGSTTRFPGTPRVPHHSHTTAPHTGTHARAAAGTTAVPPPPTPCLFPTCPAYSYLPYFHTTQPLRRHLWTTCWVHLVTFPHAVLPPLQQCLVPTACWFSISFQLPFNACHFRTVATGYAGAVTHFLTHLRRRPRVYDTATVRALVRAAGHWHWPGLHHHHLPTPTRPPPRRPPQDPKPTFHRCLPLLPAPLPVAHRA